MVTDTAGNSGTGLMSSRALAGSPSAGLMTASARCRAGRSACPVPEHVSPQPGIAARSSVRPAAVVAERPEARMPMTVD